MVVYAKKNISHITYNLEPFGDVKTPILLIPWHVHEQNLNEKKHNVLHIYVILSFQDGYLKFKKITMHSWFIDTFDEWHLRILTIY